MKIVIFEVEAHEIPLFQELRDGHELVLVERPLQLAWADDHADADVVSTFIYSELSRETLRRLTALKFIATRSTGYDHIDLAACAERGIAVANVPTYGEATVAEHVFALLLAISHRLPEAFARARNGPFSPVGLQGFDLAGKCLGVVGTGNIGRHVVRIGLGFGMEVVAHDVLPDAEFARAAGIRYVGWDELLACADVVTLHVPATPETRHLLDREAFARMKRGAVVINTARGSLIEPAALIEALRSGQLVGAGLDVLPDEPLIREEMELIASIYRNQHDLRDLVANHILLRLPNVVITPHSAFNTREAVHRIAATTLANIRAYLAGQPCNLVAAASPAART